MAILIVEDNPTNGLILRHLLKKAYAGETVVVEDPTKALILCQGQRFDLLMVDHMLPGMTGVQFVRLVRRIESFRDTPIVMVTADTSKNLRQEALDAGVDTFLTKPVEALSFAKLMDELIVAGAQLESARA
jgi:two-component system, chemotaxis family, chemotaxis protein CheY